MAGSNGRATRPRWRKVLAEKGSTTDQPVPLATRPHTLAKYSASTTGDHCAPASAKASATWAEVCSVRVSATAGWRDNAWGDRVGRQTKGCVAGRIATQRMRKRVSRTA